MKIANSPLAQITLFLIIGILYSYYTQPNFVTASLFTIICFLLFIIIALKSISLFNNNNYWFATSTYLLFFSIGVYIAIPEFKLPKSNHYYNQKQLFKTQNSLQFTIQEKIRSTANYDRFFAQLDQVNQKKVKGKILLLFKKDTNTVLEPGTVVQTKALLLPLFRPNNPNTFNYAKYLNNKGVYAQLFSNYYDLKKSSILNKNIDYYLYQFRKKIADNLEKKGFQKKELAVVLALILGQQQDVSPDTIQDYQYAGVIHILSVSGLHIGFIVLFLNFILALVPNTKIGAMFKLLATLFVLWLFALLTGLSASVIRSVVMFSFITIGFYLDRKTNIYHTLLLSLFVIILVKPLFLFDIGMQLSYISLFFIVWLQPLLQNIYNPNQKIAKYLWQLLTVSVAAQIGTLPLSIYYFHQFPGLFFISNLILVPALTIIMALGTTLVIGASVNYIPTILFKTVNFCILQMNLFIKWIAGFEAFILKDIPFNFNLLLATYLFLFCAIIWLKNKKPNNAIIVLCSLLILQLIYIKTDIDQTRTREFIVFNFNRNTILATRNNKNIYLYKNENKNISSFENKTIQSYCTANFCKIKKVSSMQNCFYLKGKKILIIDSTAIYNTSVTPDVIVLINSPKINLDRVIATINPKTIVADASNYKLDIEHWKNTCNKQKIPFHSTYEMGFFKL